MPRFSPSTEFWLAVALQRRGPAVQIVQLTVEILQVPLLGLVLDSPLLCIDRCVADVLLIMQRQVPAVLSRCDSGGASIQFIDKVGGSLWTKTGTLGQTVEIPQVQFLDTVFGDCGYWHIDEAVDVPVISRLAPVRALH